MVVVGPIPHHSFPYILMRFICTFYRSKRIALRRKWVGPRWIQIHHQPCFPLLHPLDDIWFAYKNDTFRGRWVPNTVGIRLYLHARRVGLIDGAWNIIVHLSIPKNKLKMRRVWVPKPWISVPSKKKKIWISVLAREDPIATQRPIWTARSCPTSTWIYDARDPLNQYHVPTG